jgi:hypothetical protein
VKAEMLFIISQLPEMNAPFTVSNGYGQSVALILRLTESLK